MQFKIIKILPILLACVAAPSVHAQPRSAEAAFRSINDQARQAFGSGNFAEALRLSTEARSVAERRLGRTHRLTFQAMNDIAVIHYLQGDYAAALPLALEASAGLERVAGPNDPETLNALANLGQLFFQQRHYEDAEPLLRRVYGARERVLGLDHVQTLESLLELAIFLNRVSRLPELTAELERGLAAARTKYGEDSNQARDLTDALAASRRTPTPQTAGS